MNDNIKFLVSVNDGGQLHTNLYSEDEYNNNVMPLLSKNYTPDQYSVTGLQDTISDNITEDNQYLISVSSNGHTYSKPYSGKELLGGKLTEISRQFPDYHIQYIDGAVRVDDTSDEIVSIPWDKQLSKKAGQLLRSTTKTMEQTDEVAEEAKSTSLSDLLAERGDALRNFANMAVYNGLTKTPEELEEMHAKELEEREARRREQEDAQRLEETRKQISEINKQLGEWSVREQAAGEEDFGGENIDWIVKNAERKAKLLKKRAELVKQQSENPMYRKEKKRIEGIAEDIRDKAYKVTSDISVEGDLVTYNNPEADSWRAARYFADNALKTINAPDDTENGFSAFLKGAGDTFSDVDFWTMGLESISSNTKVKRVFNKIADKVNNYSDKTLTETDFDNILTDAEKELIKSFVSASEAQALRAYDTNNMYKAGSIAADSVGFMAQFILTGGVGGAFAGATKTAAKGFAKWIAKNTGKVGKRAAIDAAVASQTLVGRGAVKLADAVATPVLKAVPMTLMQTGLYKNYAEKLTERDDAGNLTYDYDTAILPALRDAGLEVWSEMALEPVLAVFGKTISKGIANLPKASKVGAFMQTKLDDITSFLHNREAIDILTKAGFDGYFEEIGEEILAAGVSSLWEPEAWSQFWEKGNLISMAVAFAPMSVIGGGMSMANYVKRTMAYEEAAPAVREMLLNRTNITEAQLNALFDRKSATMQDIADKISDIVKPIIESGAISADEFKALYDFAGATAQKDIAQALMDRMTTDARNNMRAELNEKTGGKTIYGKDKDGNETVSIYTDANGKKRYVIIDETSEDTLALSMDEQGGNIKIVDPSELEIITMPANQYLDAQVTAAKQVEEQNQIAQQQKQQKQSVMEALKARKPVKLYSPVSNLREDYIFLGWDGDMAVVANAQTGDEERRTVQEMANALNISPSILTKDQQTQMQVEKSKRYDSLARSANDYKGAPISYEDVSGSLLRVKSKGDEQGESYLEAQIVTESGEVVSVNVTPQQIEDFIAERKELVANAGAEANDRRAKDRERKARQAKDAEQYREAKAKFINPDGSIREGEWLENDPRSYAIYSDGKYGKKDTDATLRAALTKAQERAQKALTARDNESNPDFKQPLRDEYDHAVAALDTLDSLISERSMDESASGALTPEQASEKFAEMEQMGLTSDEIIDLALQSIEETQARIDAIAKPQVSTDVPAYMEEKRKYAELVAAEQKKIDYWRSILNAPMTELERQNPDMANARMRRRMLDILTEKQSTKDAETLARLDAELQLVSEGFIGRAIADINKDNDNVVIVTEASVADRMRELGSKDSTIEQVLKAIADGDQPKGFFDVDTGVIFMVAENNYDVRDSQITFVHERQHKRTRSRGLASVLIDRLGLSGLSEEEQKSALLAEMHKLFRGNFYDGKSALTIADELISYGVERVFRGDIDGVGLNETITNFVKNIDNERGEASNLSGAGAASYGGASYRVGAEGNAAVEGVGATEVGGQGTGAAVGGEEESEGEVEYANGSTIQGLESYSRDELKRLIENHIANTLSGNGIDADIVAIELYGSRGRGTAREDSDLDAVVEYRGDIREDSMFNILNGEDSRLVIDGIGVDINPIRAEETGTMESYMKRSQEYDVQKIQQQAAAENEALFRATLQQAHDSAATSINGNKLPAAFNKIKWQEGSVNLDLGGGKFDNATEFLKGKGVENLIFDPFNRDAEWNKRIAEQVQAGGVDSVTCNNVLNVIDNEASRENVILQASKAIKPDGVAYFYIYEGDKSGIGKDKGQGRWQNNMTTRQYIPEISKYFGDVKRRGQLIEAKNPLPTDEQSVWSFTGAYDGDNELRFSVANNNQQIFISNALASLDKIQMKSGNAQAWINKIQQAGGLKKEEDKWIGLTDWLNEQKGNISKEDVAAFIREHQIRIEEVHYAGGAEDDAENTYAMVERILNEKFSNYIAEYYEQNNGENDDLYGSDSYEYALDKLRKEMNDEFPYAIERSHSDVYLTFPYEETDDLQKWADKLGINFAPQNSINSTRLDYTTDGLIDKREIALVVPTIEPYNKSDNIHFGDAGEGRAVAWVRFGSTKYYIPEYDNFYEFKKRMTEKYFPGTFGYNIPDLSKLTDEERAEYDRLESIKKSVPMNKSRGTVLVIDEIQSKRHQDGKEKGYDSVPDAPFRDSWDALAMKRMLRLAAEEGYDKIAWTSGQMQSDRYGLTKNLSDFYYKPNEDGTYKVSAALNQRRTGYTDYSDLNFDSLTVDRIGEIFGKEIAAKVSEGKGRKGYSHNDERDWVTFSGRDLKMANEGMRYFYDQRLVNWMNKYGKKWGVQVSDLTLMSLENKEGWHSIDITPEMKESVMEGQPMFRATEIAGNPSLIAVHNLTENNLLDAFDLGGFPMPSIAITKADIGHTNFGDISLVFGKETINPKNLKNKVYSGDAWTPTFPKIGYKLNYDKTREITKRAIDVGELPLFNASNFYSVNYEDNIDDMQAKSLIDNLKKDYGAKQFYLAEQGNPVREYEMHEVDKYTEEQVRRFKKVLEKIGLENLRGVDWNLTPEILQVVRETLDVKSNIEDNFIKKIARRYVANAVDYATHGNKKSEVDYDATRRKIDERIDQSAFEKWLEDLFSGIVEKRGIRNEVDPFTPIGNRRAWEKFYDEVTLDNVVKAMSKKPKRGGSGFFGGNIFGASAKTYNSISDIRKEAASRLAAVKPEEIEKQKQAILDRLSEVKVTNKELDLTEMFDLTENIRDAVAKSHTADGIHRYLKGYYPDITMDAAQEIADIVKDIQSISTKYFEAKPYRAVGFDEVKLAIVPEGTSQAVVDGLLERGVPVRTYEKNNQQERMDIISNATEEMGLRFRTIEITPEVRDEMYQIEALARLRGKYLKAPNGADTKLNPEQWAMVRTKKFKDWFGDWELAAKILNIVTVSQNHGFKNFEEAKKWAKANIVRTLSNEETGGKGEIRISNNAISKFLSESAISKSESKDIHLSVLKVLPDVIKESLDAEQHPDYKKGEDGVRSVKNGINEGVTIHRLYGAVSIDGQVYRTKVTIKEYADKNRPQKAYSYEATKIELFAGTLVGADSSNPNTNNSISAANLLNGVEKSYSPGEYLIDSSKVVDENGEPMVVYHGTGREFYTFGNTDSANELGAGFYFTDNRRLAEAYTNPRLTDNKGKIEARAMEIFIDDMGHSEEDSYDNEFVHDYNEAYDMAETELFGKPRVMSGFLNVRNPRMVVDNGNLEEEQGEHDGVIDNTFGKRHGGLMIQSRAGESAMQVMVYNPNQIKSATDNNGEFSRENDDIRYRVIPGGASMAERAYRESGAFSFTGSERINSIDDVAFIFRELENYATENSFIVFVKDGMPTILHTGIGDMRSTFVDTAAAVAGYNDFAPDTVYLVHNHPSGRLVASAADINELAKLKDIFSGVPVSGIILDTVSGNYGYFDEGINIEKTMPEEGDEFPVKVLSFDKIVFDKEFKSQLNERKIAGSNDVAAFLSAHRLGKGKKLGVLLLNNAQYIVANYVTNDNSLTTRNADRIARQVASVAVHSNANRVIMFGNFNFDDKSLSSFNSSFKKASGETMSLLDVVQMNPDGGYVSVTNDTLHGRNDGTMFRVTPAQDAEYMDAVEAGDMEKAERMVRDAAMAAGYNLEAYHGTDVDFNEFKRVHHTNGNIWGSGFYFADSEDAAAGWGERAKIANRSGDYKVLHAYLSVHNPFELYSDRLELGLGEYAEDVISKLDPEYDADIIDAIRTETPIDDYRGDANDRIADAIQELGFDAIQGYYYDEYHTMVFSPNQVKSADPVIYDDNGNVIPLSERFNTESDDIRFRISGENATFAKEDAKELANDIANEVYRQISSQENSGNLATEMDSESDGEVLFRFIGEIGADRLDKTDGGRRILNLIEAKKYYTPESAENIKRAYGWELDKDAKGNPVWKYEENDFGIKDINIKDGAKLSDVIDDEGLFAAYPELKNYTLAIEDLKDNVGYFNEVNKKIALEKGADKEDTRLTLIHEIQHFIQSKEGWVSGANSKDPLILDTVKDIFPYIREDLNMFLRSAAKRIFNKSYKKESISNFRFFKDKWGFNPIEYLFDLKKTDYLAYEAYLRNAGEVEARNAEKRADMTALERRRSLAPETEDRPRSRQWRETPYEDVMFSVSPATQLRKKGLADSLTEEQVSSITNDAFASMDEQTRRKIAAEQIRLGGDLVQPVMDYISRIAETPDSAGISQMDADIIEGVRQNLVKMVNAEDEDITTNDTLWLVYDYVHGDDTYIYDAIKNRRIRRALGQARSVAPEMSLDDYLKAAEEAKDDIIAEYRALKKLADSLTSVMDAMEARRDFDRATVGRVVKLANSVMSSNLLDDMTKGEVKRITGVIRRATGMRNIQTRIYELYNIILNNNLRRLKNLFEKELKRKASKVGSKNVVEQGRLDLNGQKIMAALKDNLDKIAYDDNGQVVVSQALFDRINDAMDRSYSEDKAVSNDAELELIGLSYARQYIEGVAASEKEEQDIKDSLKEADQSLADGKLDKKSHGEFVKEQARALAECRTERVKAFTELVQKVQDMSAASHDLAIKFVEQNKERIAQIHHEANSDLEGVPANEHPSEPTKKDRLINSSVTKFFLRPLGTFDMLLRMLGRMSPNGEGYLWNRFMRGWIDATSNEYTGIKNAKMMLDAKVSEIFGRKMVWSDLYSMVNRMPKATVKFWDGGEMREHEVTQGNLLYIMLADQMTDGRMKLRAMGITEDDVDAIRAQMDSRFISLADWIVHDFLPSRREAYNAVHERMFGAPMSKVQNYFPLRILSNARTKQVDVATGNVEQTTPSTVTGNIMKRTRNALALDIMGTDAFVLVMDHVQKMEHWAAFAEWNRDLSDLLSYKRFRNKVQNMTSVYGAKNDLYNEFVDVAMIAAGSYRTKSTKVDVAAGKLAKGVTGAKISFRLYTALKQLQSAIAYFSDANPIYIAEGFIKGWKWSRENLPMFEKRIKARDMGDQNLSQSMLPEFLEKVGTIGMSPNVGVDAFTVSAGAYALYKTKYEDYINMGFSKEAADKRAKQDAVILYNETQQSSEAAFLSTLQADRTWLSKMLSVFRNSSFAYTRQVVDASRNLAKRAESGYKRTSIEYLTKQLIREGLSDTDALKAAKDIYNRQGIKDTLRLAIYGYILPMTWGLLSSLPYLIFGDDDDKKKEMMDEAMLRMVFGPIEGLAAGNTLAEFGYKLSTDMDFKYVNNTQMPIVSDITNVITEVKSDSVRALNDIVNLATQMLTGANPQTFEDAIIGIIDACNGDLGTTKEALLLALKVINAPQSSIDQLYLDEIDMSAREASELSIPELASRYAKYKKMRNAGPFTPLYSFNPELDEKTTQKYIRQFESKAKERMKIGEENDYAEISEEAKALNDRISSLRKKANEGDSEADRQLMEIFMSPDYAPLMRFYKLNEEMNSYINKAIRAKSNEEMADYLEEANRLRGEMVEDYRNDPSEKAYFRDIYARYSYGILPEMSRLDKKYKEEYAESNPDYLAWEEQHKEERANAAAKAEANAQRILEIDAQLKKYEVTLPNGKKRYFNMPERKRLYAEKKSIREEGVTEKQILNRIDKTKPKYTEEDYMPEDIYNSPEYQIYLEMRELGSLSGNTFKFKSIESLEKQLSEEGNAEQRDYLIYKINENKMAIAKEISAKLIGDTEEESYELNLD